MWGFAFPWRSTEESGPVRISSAAEAVLASIAQALEERAAAQTEATIEAEAPVDASRRAALCAASRHPVDYFGRCACGQKPGEP